MAVVRLTDWRKRHLLHRATELFDSTCTELSGVDYTALVKTAIDRDPMKPAAIACWGAVNTFRNIAGETNQTKNFRPFKVDEIIISIEEYAVANNISKYPVSIRTRDHNLELTWETLLTGSHYRDFNKPLSYFAGCPGYDKIVEYIQRYSDSQNRLFEYKKNVTLLLDKYGSINKLLADHPAAEAWVEKRDLERCAEKIERKSTKISAPDVDIENAVVDMTLINQTLMATKLASL